MSRSEHLMMITIILNQDTQQKASWLGRYGHAIDVPEGAKTSDEMSRE
jgi:hypothetical protein